jgi:integrase
MYGLKADDTRRQYPARLRRFFGFIGVEGTKLEQQCENFVSRAHEDPTYGFGTLVKFLDHMNGKVRKKEIAFGTVKNYYKSIKRFYDMNSLNLNWKLVSSGLLPSRKSTNDRAPTKEEIRRLVEYLDPRIKAIVYMSVSGGFRVAAWDWLLWKRVVPQFSKETGEIVAAKTIIYAGEPEEYFTFITPEAYNALKSWMASDRFN